MAGVLRADGVPAGEAEAVLGALRGGADLRLLGLAEAAAELGVSTNTLRRWAEAGAPATVTTPLGRRMFPRAELARFVAGCGAADPERQRVWTARREGAARTRQTACARARKAKAEHPRKTRKGTKR